MRRPSTDELVAAIALACLATAGVASCSHAKAQTIGLHVASVHVPAHDYQKNFNPGIYARLDNGVTLGAYSNTLGRASFYGAWTTPEFYRLSLTIGAVSGYQKKLVKTETVQCVAPEGSMCINPTYQVGYYEGSSSGAVTLMLAPSIRGPELMGLTPRLSIIPRMGAGSSTVLHLSIEKAL